MLTRRRDFFKACGEGCLMPANLRAHEHKVYQQAASASFYYELERKIINLTEIFNIFSATCACDCILDLKTKKLELVLFVFAAIIIPSRRQLFLFSILQKKLIPLRECFR